MRQPGWILKLYAENNFHKRIYILPRTDKTYLSWRKKKKQWWLPDGNGTSDLLEGELGNHIGMMVMFYILMEVCITQMCMYLLELSAYTLMAWAIHGV